jgi:hypothetical protein
MAKDIQTFPFNDVDNISAIEENAFRNHSKSQKIKNKYGIK